MKYVPSDNSIEISVRELCEFSFRRGNLDKCQYTDYARMQLGSEIHKKLQAERGEGYAAEVPFEYSCEHCGITFKISGRADGVINNPQMPLIEEIKTVNGGVSDDSREMYAAQLSCYAFFLCEKEQYQSATLRLTYYDITQNKETHRDRIVSYADLNFGFYCLLEKVSPRANILKQRGTVFLPSAKDARFPYPEIRESQEQLIRECWLDIKNGDRLFAEAPTGIGKTISTLYPAARALGNGIADRIFYLTAKSSTRREAYSACAKLYEGGAKLRCILLYAKNQTCLCPECISADGTVKCDPKICPYARGYYDRAEAAITMLAEKQLGYNRDSIIAAAKQFSVCPHELSLDLSELCDIIICDYNYVFSPGVYLRRYFDDEMKTQGGKNIFLIDEAHNLPDRARDMYSASISLSEIKSAVPSELAVDPETGEPDAFAIEIIECVSELSEFIEVLSRRLVDTDTDAAGNKVGWWMSRDFPRELSNALNDFSQKAFIWLKKNPDSLLCPGVEALCTSVRGFQTVLEWFDEKFLNYVSVENGDVKVGVFCIDPSEIMDKLLSHAYSSVLFSATFTPNEYFSDVLGCRNNSVSVSFESPFSSDKLCVAVMDKLSTRMDDRESGYASVASCIAGTVSAKHGNYIVYFPSYAYLDGVFETFVKRYPKVSVTKQKRGMSFTTRDEFLNFFKEDVGVLRIGFCVLGGMFSEGVDLPGSRLIGSIIVGVGLPGLSNERNLIRDYYDERDNCGYDYAYVFPGFKNVMQAAGRVIRTDTDRGIVVLIDDRYADAKYRRMMPASWKNVKYAGNAKSLAEIARNFWEKEIK